MPTRTRTTSLEIANDFWVLLNSPNPTGAIDGKHGKIQTPLKSSFKFSNYTHRFSIVLLALLDVPYKFTFVDIG
jgi:hypothetical protein